LGEATGAVASNRSSRLAGVGFVIELSDEERAALQRHVACDALPHKVVMRAKMILQAAEGQPPVADSAPLSGPASEPNTHGDGWQRADADRLLLAARVSSDRR